MDGYLWIFFFFIFSFFDQCLMRMMHITSKYHDTHAQKSHHFSRNNIHTQNNMRHVTCNQKSKTKKNDDDDEY